MTEQDPELLRLRRRNEKLSALLEVAKAMIAERNLDALLDLIMAESVKTVDAERCTLFIVDAKKRELWSKIAHGLGKGHEILRLPLGSDIAGTVAESGRPLNIIDAYADGRFNRAFDQRTGYRTHTILCVPMIGTQGQVVGVVQALNHVTGPFTDEDQELLMALGANAAAAIENASLYQDIEQLFEGFVQASVTAIEQRDPTTSGHSGRVASLSVTLLELLPRAGDKFAHLRFSREDIRELRYASLLHDFGKVGVRENVLVKAEKLYPHEISLIEARFERAICDCEIGKLREMLATPEAERSTIEHAWADRLGELKEMLEFVRRCNRPTVLEQGGFERLRVIAERSFADPQGQRHALLSPAEVENLSIGRGSLNPSERLEIESHVTHTYNFLRQIPWTRDLARVPDIAFGHHEKLDGTGYPRGVPGGELPVQTRIMTISDIYDALTASDRPYKAALPHDRAVSILEDEAKKQKVDAALLKVFVEAEIPKRALRTP